MKEGILRFFYFTKDDYVITPEGVGIVFEDEGTIVKESDFCTSEINIQHKSKSSNNSNNKPIKVIRDYIRHISKDLYDKSEAL